MAIETLIGWTLLGPIEGSQERAASKARLNHTIASQQDCNEQSLHQFWDFESLGITGRNEVLEDLNEGVEFRNGKYTLNLPWKEPKYALLDNYNLSLASLKSQIKRLKKDENIAKQYDQVIKEKLRDGILEEVLFSA